MQLMPDTFAELRTKHGLGPDRYDPQTNISAGTAYLGQLYKQFGNWRDAIAAYNAGPGRWAAVKAGKQAAPRETTDYVQKVTGAPGYGQAAASVEMPAARDVEKLPVPQALQPDGRNEGAGNMAGGGLLSDATNNWLDGLGGLLGEGQTASQPPGPSMSPFQYQLAGAGNAVSHLAGVRDRKVGIGELLGAMGGGLMQGTAAAQQAARVQRADQRAETGERFDNVYKLAMTRKALAPTTDADRYKVVGKQVYDTRTGQFIAAPGGTAEGGPFPSEGLPSQLLNTYYTLEQKRVNGGLNAQEQLLYDLTAQQLSKPRLVTGPDGVVREVAPPPLPALPNAGAGAAPPAAAPPAPGAPPPVAVPPPAAPPPAAAPGVTLTPSGSRVTEVVPPRAKEIPATVQNNLLANVNALRAVENAIASTAAAPDATGVTAGLLNMLPGGVVNKVMPGGTKARADISDIGSLKIHDRSGAAVTVSEFPRLAPFVPQVSDDAATVAIKLQRFREELAGEIRDQEALYGADQGYRPNPILQEVVKTGRAPRYEAPMEGAGAGSGAAGKLSDDELRSKLGL
jgi:hypothetical protein